MRERPAAGTSRLDKVLAAGLARAPSIGAGERGAGVSRAAPINTLRTANRGEPDHLSAIAVLAYSNGWDKFVNDHLRGLTATNLREFADGAATRFSAIFAFFAPLSDLVAVFPSITSATVISVALPDQRADDDNAPACRLLLKINGSTISEAGVSWADEIARMFIIPAGVRAQNARSVSLARVDLGLSALNTWHATLSRIAMELERVTKVSTGAVDEEVPLYRGMTDVPQSTLPVENETLVAFSTGYTSTTFNQDIARQFSTGDSQEMAQRAQRSWFLQLMINGEGVRYIDVHKVLPNAWVCFAGESELIIAPGAVFVVEQVQLIGDVLHLSVRVTAAAVEFPDDCCPLPTTQDELDQLLHTAVEQQRTELAARLRDVIRDDVRTLPTTQDELDLLLLTAVKQQRTVLVSRLLDANANANSRSGTETALYLAVTRDDEEIVDELLTAGALVDAHVPLPSGEMGTALMLANTVPIARALLDAHANANAVTFSDDENSWQRSVLTEACVRQRTEIVKLLLFTSDVHVNATLRYSTSHASHASRASHASHASHALHTRPSQPHPTLIVAVGTMKRH